jgi:soluble lytic murein transglycosylase-like protein
MKIFLTIVFLCFFVTVNSQAFQKNLDRNHCFAKSIASASKKYDLPVELIKAVITVESNSFSKAKGKANCIGLMQIRNGSNDYHRNIMSGKGILKHYLNKCKNDTAKALTAYNMGYTGMKRYYKKYGHASNYAKRVLKFFNLLKYSRKKL